MRQKFCSEFGCKFWVDADNKHAEGRMLDHMATKHARPSEPFRSTAAIPGHPYNPALEALRESLSLDREHGPIPTFSTVRIIDTDAHTTYNKGRVGYIAAYEHPEGFYKIQCSDPDERFMLHAYSYHRNQLEVLMPIESWEYGVYDCAPDLHHSTLQRTMNSWGRDGWELVVLVFHALHFKRKVTANRWVKAGIVTRDSAPGSEEEELY